MPKTFNTYSAETGEALPGNFPIANEKTAEFAMTKAAVAFSSFSKTSGEARALLLEEIALELEALGDELIDRASLETGLPKTRIIAERGRTVFQLQSFAKAAGTSSWVEARIDTAQLSRKPIPKVDIRKMLMPIGPVVVFGASNFPLAYSTAGGDTASALAAGNTVVVKAHPAHAGTSELVAGAIKKAVGNCGIDENIFHHLHDTGFELGQNLVTHPATKAVGFTGSLSGGRALFNLANKREEPIPVFAEMGSTNPVVLLSEAMTENGVEIGETLASSITLGMGQFCTNPGLLLGIRSSALNNFKASLSAGIQKSLPATMLHKGICNKFVALKKSALSQEGVKRISESGKDTISNQGRPTVATVNGSDFLINPNLHHEVFGPFSLLVECEDKQELLTVIQCLKGQLTGSIFASEQEMIKHEAVLDALKSRVGRIIYNGVPTGVEVCDSMQHGGPYPASTDSRFTAVGPDAIKRFARPVSFQNWPQNLLPDELKDENPKGIMRVVNGNRPTSSGL